MTTRFTMYAASAIVAAMASYAVSAATSTRIELLAIPVTDQLGGATTRPASSDSAFSLPAANIGSPHRRIFSFGNRLFNTNWTAAPGSVKSFDGLGPLFNRVSCSGCHTRDGRGRPSETGQGPMDSMLIRLSIPGQDELGGPKAHPAYGDQLNERAIGTVAVEGRVIVRYEAIPGVFADGERFELRRPAYEVVDLGYGSLGDDTMLSPRVAPAVFGLGLLEAVPGETLQSLADPEDRDGDGISGRLNMVWDQSLQQLAIGRFGWKANQPSLLQQNAGAARGEIGLTTPLALEPNCTTRQKACQDSIDGGTPELSREFLDKLTLYVMTLAVPAQRKADDPLVRTGARLFRDFKCASCL